MTDQGDRPATVVISCRRRGGTADRRQAEPVTLGVPWPPGALAGVEELALRDGDGRELALQARLTEQWADGSVRWALLDWFADIGEGAEESRYVIEARAGARPSCGRLEVETEPGNEAIEVYTGAARFRLSTGRRFPFDSVEVAGNEAIDPDVGGFVVRDRDGDVYGVRVRSVRVTELGPIRSAVDLDGDLVGPARASLAEVRATVHFFAGSATVRLELTLLNPRCAGHPGGLWSLGSSGSIYLRDASLRFAPRMTSRRITCSPEPGSEAESVVEPFVLHQESSGGENWRSRNHVNREGRVPLRFAGYRLQSGDNSRSGRRATPVVALEGDGCFLALTVRDFWQNFPKAVAADSDGIRVGLFPEEHDNVHEIQGGEQKTHVLHIAFASDPVSKPQLDWCRRPLLPLLEPSWYATSEAVPYLLPRTEDPHAEYLALVDSALDDEHGFVAKREAIDEYGWRHFGDLYADHEAALHGGDQPLVSHYNNQYDAIAGCAIQHMRSGDPRWLALMDEMARHVADIDVYHTDRDKSAYNHGMFWHTFHYVDVGTSSHRSYPRAPGVPGGGPSPGHLYTTGLLLHYLMTGDRRSRRSALELAQYAIGCDDGTRTPLRFLDRGSTGMASESGGDRYHGPGRTPANAIVALLDGHRLSGERSFLVKAEQLIRRCIHPRADLGKQNLLDTENRWYYTVFLQALGRYLDYKATLGELDESYAYARASLLHYARWAREHEYPYLDKPEILEYPNETWAAQDMRKSEVFKIASRHGRADEREGFLERARFFFDQSVAALTDSPTRTLCRPVVLMLSNGYSQGLYDTRPVPPAPSPEVEVGDFGTPSRPFRSQKQRALRKIGILVAVGSGLLIAGGLLILLRLVAGK